MPNNQIIVERMANGWIVVLPTQNNYDPFRAQMEVMKDVIKGVQGEDEIAEIQRRNEQIETRLGDIQRPQISAHQNVHVFLKFSEVLAFLKHTIDEK